MKLHTFRLPLAALGLATTALISACGGSSSPNNDPTTLSGQVIDGYIKGAKVCLDLNSNNACDSGEPSATSGDKGAYSLTVPVGTDISALHVIAKVPTGATETDSNGTATSVAAAYTMLSPATMASVVSPLTTVVSHEMKNNSKSVADARIAARTDLGLDIAYDFMKDHIKANDTAGMNAAKAMAGFLATSVGSNAPSKDLLKTALDSFKASNGGGNNNHPASPTDPTTAAPTPSKLAADVKSLFSDAYTNISVADWSPNWGQTTTVSEIAVSGNKIKKYSTLNYQGVAINDAGIDVSAYTNLHIDVYGQTALKVSLISPNPTAEQAVNITSTGTGWNSIDIPLSSYTTPVKTKIFQLKFESVTPSATIYYDNLYFWKDPTGGNAGGGNGGGGTPFVGTSTVTFDAGDSTGAVLLAGWNGATSSVEASPPAGGNSKAGKIVVTDQAQYHGATFLVLKDAEMCSATNPNISVRVHTPAAGTSVELKLEQDGDPTKNTELRKNTTVAGWETITFNCLTASDHAADTSPYSEINVYNKVSILFDMPNKSAGTKTYYFDDVSYTPTTAVTYVPPAVGAEPTTSPADPTKAAADVKSLYSETYAGTSANVVVGNWNPNWGQNTVVSEVTVGTNKIRKYANLNYQGVDISDAGIDVSAYTNLHIDVYATGASLQVFLISPNPTTEQSYTVTTTGTGWNSFDIPLTSFTTPDKTKIFQLKFVATNPGGTVYYDNLYFWK